MSEKEKNLLILLGVVFVVAIVVTVIVWWKLQSQRKQLVMAQIQQLSVSSNHVDINVTHNVSQSGFGNVAGHHNAVTNARCDGTA